MREANGDLFTFPADAVVITTNGYVKTNGTAVMGRGVAAQAAKRWPRLPAELGLALRMAGNHTHVHPPILIEAERPVVTLPVKHLWHQPADKALIERSLNELVILADERRHWCTMAMPRPGCGNGQLDWAEIGPLCASILDDRFVVVYNG